MNEQERQPSCNAMGQRLIFSSSAAAILHCYGLATGIGVTAGPSASGVKPCSGCSLGVSEKLKTA
eukprot:COSAG03_NODE_13644_length_494_cov_0.891139_1_plen_64_part_10